MPDSIIALQRREMLSMVNDCSLMALRAPVENQTHVSSDLPGDLRGKFILTYKGFGIISRSCRTLNYACNVFQERLSHLSHQ